MPSACQRRAPSIAQLLRLALSRTRELDADATALELTGDSRALIAALDKLERHHVGLPVLSLTAREDDPMRLLRSHPATSERVGALLSFAHRCALIDAWPDCVSTPARAQSYHKNNAQLSQKHHSFVALWFQLSAANYHYS